MILSFVLFGIFQGLLPELPCVSAQSASVDNYCFSQMPASKKTLKSNVGILHFIRMCSDIDKFSYCLLEQRKVANDMFYKIQPYETKFPSEYDLRRAGFLFCSDYLPKNVDSYIVDEELLVRCETPMNREQCNNQFQSGDMLEKMNKVIQSGNAREIETMSCNMSYGHIKCIRDLYVQCDKTYEQYFVYKMARLGPECLRQQNEYSPLLHVQVCAKKSTAGGRAGRMSRLVANVEWILTLVAVAALTFCRPGSFRV